jgi:hypothetical protein
MSAALDLCTRAQDSWGNYPLIYDSISAAHSIYYFFSKTVAEIFSFFVAAKDFDRYITAELVVLRLFRACK